MKERRSGQKSSLKSSMDASQSVKCKIVVVGDSQCGKTALLHVFAKDCFPESYVPTVFENYTASFEIDTQRIELSLWDTSGSPYYDNVRPLSYPDSDAVLICFDISRPETLDSVLKKVGVCSPLPLFLFVKLHTSDRTEFKTHIWRVSKGPITGFLSELPGCGNCLKGFIGSRRQNAARNCPRGEVGAGLLHTNGPAHTLDANF
uniref:Rho family GTPase 3 n=1 Tax=Oryzias sinensis TaxID=183150 RepID=A0A8C7YRN2_9TELE